VEVTAMNKKGRSRHSRDKEKNTGKIPPTEEEQAGERAKRARAVSEVTASHNVEPTAEPHEQE
jgi:hypothetical protein